MATAKIETVVQDT